MRRLFRHRPRPATAVACLALALTLGGASYAAVSKLLPKNGVGSAQVVNGSLQTKDLSKKAIAALHGARGARGPQGVQGARGTTGVQGAKGDRGDAGAQGVQGIEGPTGPAIVSSHAANMLTTLDSAGDVGRYTSATI